MDSNLDNQSLLNRAEAWVSGPFVFGAIALIVLAIGILRKF